MVGNVPSPNVTPGRFDLIGDNAIAPNADFFQELDLDLKDVTAVLSLSNINTWEVFLKDSRDDEDADAVVTGDAATIDADAGWVNIQFLGTDLPSSLIGSYWWVLRGTNTNANPDVTQIFVWGVAEIKYL